MDVHSTLGTLLAIAVVAVLAPVLAAVLPGPRIPQVVLLLVGGMLIGPQGLDLGVAREGSDPGRRRARLPVPPRRVRGRPAAAARGSRAPRGAVLAGHRRAGGRGRRAAVRRWPRPGVRAGRHRAHDDGAGHAAAHPAREPPVGWPARRAHARGRRDRRAAADRRSRPVPRHDQPVRRDHLPGGGRGRRVRPDLPVAVVPCRADPHVHRGGRARDHADERPRHRSAADPAARGDRGVPPRCRARRLRGGHGAAAVGGAGPAGVGGQAGRARLRLLHPGLLRLLGHVDGPAVDGVGPAARADVHRADVPGARRGRAAALPARARRPRAVATGAGHLDGAAAARGDLRDRPAQRHDAAGERRGPRGRGGADGAGVPGPRGRPAAAAYRVRMHRSRERERPLLRCRPRRSSSRRRPASCCS